MSATALVEPRRSWFGRASRRAEERALTRDNLPAVMLPASAAGASVTPQSALGIVDVLACVRILAETASTLPLVAYRRAAGGRVRLESGRTAELLRRPSPGNTQCALVSQLVGSLVLRGNAYLGKFRNGEGEIEQIALLPPDRVRVELRGGVPLYELAHESGRLTTHDASDVLHLKTLSADGVLGLSPIGLAREALGLALALEQQASAIVANDATPLGVLSVPPGPEQSDVMENLRAGFEARHRGARNSGRVAVLAGEIKFSPVSLSPVDADFVAQRKLSTQEICRLFRVPGSLVNAESGGSLTYSTSETEALGLVKFSLAPLLVVVEQGISGDPDLCPGGAYVEFLVDGLLRADSATRASVYSAALDPVTGWLRRDEVRQLENLDPEPETALAPEAA